MISTAPKEPNRGWRTRTLAGAMAAAAVHACAPDRSTSSPTVGRKQLVAADFGESVLIPAGDATVRIVSQGKQPLGSDPQDIHQVPYIHRGRPALAGAPRRVLDAGDRTRHASGSLGYQLDGILARHLPVEAALCADRTVRLPPHDETLSDLRWTRSASVSGSQKPGGLQ